MSAASTRAGGVVSTRRTPSHRNALGWRAARSAGSRPMSSDGAPSSGEGPSITKSDTHGARGHRRGLLAEDRREEQAEHADVDAVGDPRPDRRSDEDADRGRTG